MCMACFLTPARVMRAAGKRVGRQTGRFLARRPSGTRSPASEASSVVVRITSRMISGLYYDISGLMQRVNLDLSILTLFLRTEEQLVGTGFKHDH